MGLEAGAAYCSLPAGSVEVEVEGWLNRVKPQDQEHCFRGGVMEAVVIFVIDIRKLLVKVVECKEILDDIEDLLVRFIH